MAHRQFGNVLADVLQKGETSLKLRMLWFIIAISIIAAIGLIQEAHADVVTGTGMATQIHVGPLNLNVPFNEVDVTYLFDVISKRNLVGGETPIATIWKLQGTLGAVTSVDGQGAPYIGGKLVLPNLPPNLGFLSTVQPGLFGGYDWNRGSAIAGFKADIPIF